MTIQELRWPPGWPRSRSRNDWGARFNYQGRQITIDRAEELLRDALRRMCATRVAVTLSQDGAAVYFTHNGSYSTHKGKPMVIACDRYCVPAANLRSIGIAVEALATLERHGGGAMADRAFSGFMALPGPDQATARSRSHWGVLGLGHRWKLLLRGIIL